MHGLGMHAPATLQRKVLHQLLLQLQPGSS